MVRRTMEVYRQVLRIMEAILALLFGLLIGSFLNVCIHRWPRDRSVVRPALALRALPQDDRRGTTTFRWSATWCSAASAGIAAATSPCRYPLVELITGLLFFFFVADAWARRSRALKMCVFSAILIALIFSDLEKRILPDELTLGGTLIGLAFAVLRATAG